jgi:PAS domain S-box-containing protein
LVAKPHASRAPSAMIFSIITSIRRHPERRPSDACKAGATVTVNRDKSQSRRLAGVCGDEINRWCRRWPAALKRSCNRVGVWALQQIEAPHWPAVAFLVSASGDQTELAVPQLGWERPLQDERSLFCCLYAMESFARDRGEPEAVLLSGYDVIRQVQDHAMFLLDRHGRIATWNLGVRAVFGYEQDEWVGLPLAEIFSGDDREAGRPEEELRTALSNGRADDDRWMQRRSGQRFFASGTLTRIVDGNGGHLGFLKVVRDQTEPLRALEERGSLLDSERKARLEAERQAAALTAAIEAIPDGVYIGDANGILRCNKPALEILGASSLEELNPPAQAFGRDFKMRRERTGEELAPDELPYVRALKG